MVKEYPKIKKRLWCLVTKENDFSEQVIQKEMCQVCMTFKPFDKLILEEVRPGQAGDKNFMQNITFHMLFDKKTDFSWKARSITNGANIMARDSIKLIFLIATLNNTTCCNKIQFRVGIKCDKNQGKDAGITRPCMVLEKYGHVVQCQNRSKHLRNSELHKNLYNSCD